MQQLLDYFPELTKKQIELFKQLKPLYLEWNDKVNVISRKDMENFYEHHVLHSLAVAKIISFKDHTKIIDVGTGGGFPGIPLAIMFPKVQFHLVDSIGKKIKVVQAIIEALKLPNVTAEQKRSEEIRGKYYDFVVSRAVTNFPDFIKQTRHLIETYSKNKIANGVIYLKGGDFKEEIKPFGRQPKVYDISEFYEDEFFETKRIITLPLSNARVKFKKGR